MVKVLQCEGSTVNDGSDQVAGDLPQEDMQVVLSNIGTDGSGAVVALDDSAVTDSCDPPFKIDVLENDEYSGTPFLSEGRHFSNCENHSKTRFCQCLSRRSSLFECASK